MVINLLLLIPVAFYALGALLDSVMDNIKDHWSTSVFNNPARYNPYYFNPALSWKDKYINDNQADGHKKWVVWFITIDVPDALTDFWHNCKMLREGCNILAILSMQFAITPIPIVWWIYLIEGLILSIFRNESFDLGYNHLFVM